MVEQYILPMVGNYIELVSTPGDSDHCDLNLYYRNNPRPHLAAPPQDPGVGCISLVSVIPNISTHHSSNINLAQKVLSYKLKASFYHIFVLFHNEPAVNDRINRRRSGSFSLFPDPLSPKLSTTSSTKSPSRTRQRSPAISLGGPVGGSTTRTPPGLPLPSTYPYMSADGNGNGTATFLLPLQDYTAYASAAFKEADDLAERLLPGSHPVRLSVNVEYIAYIYDCLHEAERSRRMARLAIRHVYEAQEGMDDESFEDAAESKYSQILYWRQQKFCCSEDHIAHSETLVRSLSPLSLSAAALPHACFVALTEISGGNIRQDDEERARSGRELWQSTSHAK